MASIDKFIQGGIMFLVRMLYASKSAANFKAKDIENILMTARTYNTKNRITGMLCFNQTYFLQCLEGPRAEINQLYHAIINDNRHQDIVILYYQEIINREFSEWSMGYIPHSKLTHDIIIKNSGTDEFIPMQMSGSSALSLMLDARNVVPVL